MDPVAQWAVYQREEPRLSLPGGAVRGAWHYPVGAALLRGSGLLWAVHRRPALARAVRWHCRGGLVLLLRSGHDIRLAHLHPDVYPRLADRGRLRDLAVGGTGHRGRIQ